MLTCALRGASARTGSVAGILGCHDHFRCNMDGKADSGALGPRRRWPSRNAPSLHSARLRRFGSTALFGSSGRHECETHKRSCARRSGASRRCWQRLRAGLVTVTTVQVTSRGHSLDLNDQFGCWNPSVEFQSLKMIDTFQASNMVGVPVCEHACRNFESATPCRRKLLTLDIIFSSSYSNNAKNTSY
jgi:hypothetical protein